MRCRAVSSKLVYAVAVFVTPMSLYALLALLGAPEVAAAIGAVTALVILGR
jgi:hypothetical protein